MPAPGVSVIALAGRYRLESELGRGGMGVVHLAWDLKQNRHVAVKVLTSEAAAVIGRDRFLREIDIAAGLSHPHILKLYDSGEEDGLLYYVTPHVEGRSLAHRIQHEELLPISESLRIAREIADALGYAHSKGVVHRDIKPENILLESDHAIVSDFGIALLANSVPTERLTGTGFTIGTPIYMSPEQSLGQRDVDGRSDIYSLGCVLYEMLSGEPPFGRRDAQTILARKMANPPSLRVARTSVSEALERVTNKALCRQPADRFQTAREFADALDTAAIEQYRANAVIGSDPGIIDLDDGDDLVGISPRPRRFRRFSLEWFVVAAIGVVALLFMAGFLANAVYDVRMNIPDDHSSGSRSVIEVGWRALMPGLIVGLMWFTGYFVVKQVGRLLMAWIQGFSAADRSLQHPVHSTSVSDRLLGIPTATAAEWFIIGSSVISLIVLLTFGSFLRSLYDGSNELLALSCYSQYERFTIAMSGCVLLVGAACLRVVPWLRARNARTTSILLARWGGLVIVVALLLLMAAPWRLYYDNDKPRAVLNGRPVYILAEEADDLVLYDATLRTTQHYHRTAIPELTRLGTDGYVFEHEEGCSDGSR